MRCLRCGGIAESRHRHDMRYCPCGAIAADGGLEYERVSGAALEDASWVPLYEYADGASAAEMQFTPMLTGAIGWGWDRGDGRAMQRLIATLKSGVIVNRIRLALRVDGA